MRKILFLISNHVWQDFQLKYYASIFGGYVLGIIAFNTRSIWGGIFIHVGVAWLMEVCAYLSMQL